MVKIQQLLYRHAFWRSLSFGGAFAFNILFARSLGAAVSGEIFYLCTVFAFAIQLVSLSLESGVGFYAARRMHTDGQLLGLSLLWSFVAAAVASGALYGFTPALHLPQNYPASYAVCFITGNLLMAFGNAFCYSRYLFVLPGAIAAGANLLLIVLLLAWPAARIRSSFITIYFLSFPVQGFFLFLIPMLRYRLTFSFRIPRVVISDVFGYSLKAFAGNLLFLAMSRVDYFFVDRYCDPADLGNYIQVSRIAQAFFIFPSMIASLLFPVIAGHTRDGAAAGRVRLFSAAITTVYAPVLVMLALAGYRLFPELFGHSFDRMFLPFLLLVPGIIAISALYPYTAYYSATNQLRVNIRGSLIALLAIAAGDALLVPRYGIRAAALVSSAGYLIFCASVVWPFSREFRLSPGKLFTLTRQDYLHIIERLKR